MATRLKDIYFTPQSLQNMARRVHAAYPAFDGAAFLGLVYADGWESLELKQRMRRTTEALHAMLPGEYADALTVLEAAAPFIDGFDALTFCDYVEVYGQHDWERSMRALRNLTRYGSGEFAVRPFLRRDLEPTLAVMETWARDSDARVRRLASEGSRPRLPWGSAVPRLRDEPALVLPILEQLRNDESDDVRRSVANSLNDISKDHPDLVVSIARRWLGRSARTDAMLKHALRGLLKRGDPAALALFGVRPLDHVRAERFRVQPEQVRIGDVVRLRFDLVIDGDSEARVRLEYAVHFVNVRSTTTRKVFQIGEGMRPPGTHQIERRHDTRNRTTRMHYPGRHRVELIVNGQVAAESSFLLRSEM
jgi:3-methyladenine DNA glycosylase AlkC